MTERVHFRDQAMQPLGIAALWLPVNGTARHELNVRFLDGEQLPPIKPRRWSHLLSVAVTQFWETRGSSSPQWAEVVSTVGGAIVRVRDAVKPNALMHA
jgi:hypothetical protein